MSKFTKFAAASVALVAMFTVAHMALADTIVVPPILQVGSSGDQVVVLQADLGITQDGAFGPMTQAAVMAFQTAHGLTADGVVGPLTAAALNGSSMSSYPAGCTSTTGYSTTTGQSCATAMTFPAGCTSNVGFSSTTGMSCTSGTTTVTLPAGCTSTAGFSTTTGASCSTGITTTSSGSTGSVTSGPFSINSAQPLSGYYNTQVGVGQENKVIGDMRIVAGSGGSGTLSGVNLAFYNRGDGNYQFPVYAQSVSILLNGTVVGTLPASSFTQYDSQYSAFIPTTNAVLNPNTTNDIQIAVTALPVIDSANLTSSTVNDWAFELTAIRYTDSTGSFSYTIPSGNNFDSGNIVSGTLQSSAVFASASTASDITLTVTKDVNDYNNRVVSASTASQTQNQSLAIVDLAAQGAPVTVNRLPVTVVVSGNSGTAGNDVAYILNTLALYKGNSVTGQPIDSEATNGSTVTCSTVGTGSLSGTTSASDVNTCTVTFQNLDLTIPAGSTQVVTIAGNVNALDGTIVEAGAAAQVSVTSTNVDDIQAYDQNNNILNNNTSNILIGSTTGSVITFYVNGIQVTSAGTATATATSPGGSQSHSIIGMTIPFAVTAFGQPAYVPDTATAATAASSAHTIQFCVDNATGACQAVGTGVITYAGSNGLIPDGSGNYQISAGQTQNFTLQITYTANGSASYRGSLLNVNWSNSDTTSGFSTYTSGLDQAPFQTNYVVGS